MFRKAIQLRSRLFPVATGQAAAAMHTGAEVHKDDENLHNLLQERWAWHEPCLDSPSASCKVLLYIMIWKKKIYNRGKKHTR